MIIWISSTTALLSRVLADAAHAGYAAVEGYARLQDGREPFDFHGPVRLYQNAGFAQAARQGDALRLRKAL